MLRRPLQRAFAGGRIAVLIGAVIPIVPIVSKVVVQQIANITDVIVILLITAVVIAHLSPNQCGTDNLSTLFLEPVVINYD
ncbi:hypothetical protein B0O99DRAFT_644085 [Bisporella sp. PMI_857]|nr:hypothetical protein B0O99DRAFT_644085 [Bisporella sp. PMI_857]